MAPGVKKYPVKIQAEELNLLKVLTPIYITLSLIGLFPYSLKLRNRQQKPSIIPKSLYLNIFCTAIYTMLMSIFFAIHVYHIFFLNLEAALAEGLLAEVNYVIEMLLLLLFCIVSYYNVYGHREQILYILNKMSAKMDAPNTGRGKVLKKIQKEVNRVVYFLIFLVITQMLVNGTRDDGWWKIILVLMTFLIPHTIEFCMIAFFYVIMISNKELLTNIRKTYIPLMYGNDGRNIKTVEPKYHLLNMREVELIYLDVLKIMQWVTHIFEAPFLLIVLQCLHSIVSQVHILYTGIAIYDSLVVHDIVNCVIWTAYQYVKIFFMAKAGTAFKLEVQQLGFSILNIPVERQDVRFMLEIQHVISLIQLQRNNLTIYGYLSLDATLVFKMVTASMTYVVIIMQFIR